LKYRFQGQLKSNVNTDLNSQHVVSFLLPIQTMALSSTVFEIFNIFICIGNPIPTPKYGDNSTIPQNRNGKNCNPQNWGPNRVSHANENVEYLENSNR